MIDAYCSQPHYAEHLMPVLNAVSPSRRGTLYVHPADRHDKLLQHFDVTFGYPPTRGSDPIIIAGYQDQTVTHRPLVLLSHGAGQTYEGVNLGSYDGGPGRDCIQLHLCPNEASAQRNRDRYPHSIAVAIGCPKLDRWMQIPPPEEDVLAVAFHWNCRVVPEAGWAWSTWAAAIEKLAQIRPVIGHCHPRARRDLKPWFLNAGIEYVEHAIDLLDRARTLIIDNSSLAYEWAACDRRVVFIDDVLWENDRHGLRFGAPLPGPNAGKSGLLADLLGAITRADNFRHERRFISAAVYGRIDGHASERAAVAVQEAFPVAA